MIPLKIMFVGYIVALGFIVRAYFSENPRWFIWSLLVSIMTTLYGALRLIEYLL